MLRLRHKVKKAAKAAIGEKYYDCAAKTAQLEGVYDSRGMSIPELREYIAGRDFVDFIRGSRRYLVINAGKVWEIHWII